MDNKKKTGLSLAIPFLVVLGALSVVSFILPLRPSVSYSEKRELAKFPTFSAEALFSGSYFSDITAWYSDTFPGRESWIGVAQTLSSAHGYGEITIQGALLEEAPAVPVIPEPTRPQEVVIPPTEAVTEATAPAETAPTEAVPAETPPAMEETAPAEETEDVLLDVIISSQAVIQMGDAAFYPLNFSQVYSDRYAQALSKFAAIVAENGTRVISCPPPTAISMAVDPSLLPQLNSAPQGDILNYMHGSMAENIVTVNTYEALAPHRGEYLFFRTDHHWTALAAYYCYAAACEAMGKTPAALEDMEVIDQGEFKGSMYGRVSQPVKMRTDNVYVYKPQGDLIFKIYSADLIERDGELFRDMTNQDLNTKYLTFLHGDQPMVRITNEALPDAGNCLIVKDSFGNCFVPYFSQNYHNVYAIDYRKFNKMTLQYFVTAYDIQDIIFAPNLMSTQSVTGVDILVNKCGYMQ